VAYPISGVNLLCLRLIRCSKTLHPSAMEGGGSNALGRSFIEEKTPELKIHMDVDF
jgi:hypothetical protein